MYEELENRLSKLELMLNKFIKYIQSKLLTTPTTIKTLTTPNNCDKITKKMNCQPKYDNLEFICKTASYEWEKKLKEEW